MNPILPRRTLFTTAAGGALAAGLLTGTIPAHAQPAEKPKSLPLWPGFPRQDAALAYQVVGMSHSNEAKVKELVKAHPPLVNAWWDWGFGDWESPLGAASHVGQRGIAEFLIANGARIDIFAAAMLGYTEVVKSFVTAQPGIQRTLGPHGITLLAHARAGGLKAAGTVDYLKSLGDADQGIKTNQLTAEQKQVYLGKYTAEDLHLECRLNKNGQLILDVKYGKADPVARFMHNRKDDEFYTAGVPSIRIQFSVTGGKATSVTIAGQEPLVVAKRIDG